ncbi:hypothetical protein CXF68_14190 [Tenacibaculum sp. Bg11-29]|nr:hypothetical protein CXF68_14190 [Tenacibaculum sp. Bg11-29]
MCMEWAIFTPMNLVFDLDNTLINRNKAYQKWLASFLKIENDNFFDWKIILEKDNWGYTPREFFYKWLINNFSLDFTPDLLINKCANELHFHIDKDPKTIQLLKKLSKNHQLFIATNGGEKNQMNKLKKSGLLEIINSKNIFISEKMKCKKPNKQFFDMIEKCISNTQKTVMIGDDPINDVLGAKQNNWETIWLKFNRELEVNTDFEIQNINELESLLYI